MPWPIFGGVVSGRVFELLYRGAYIRGFIFRTLRCFKEETKA